MRGFVNLVLLTASVLLITSLGFAGGVTPLQVLFIAKKTFAEKSDANILIDKKTFQKNEKAIKRAGTQMQIELKVFVISSKADVGNAFKQIEKNSLLILFDSELLTNSAIKLYVLLKCKDRHISIITSSREYGDSGALLSVFTDEEGKTKVQLNLQKNKAYKDRFSEELIQQSGINAVLL